MSENIGGPGDQCIGNINDREQNDCTINSSEEKKKVAQRMEDAIKQKNMQYVKGTFSIAIDGTKVAQVLEVSHVWSHHWQVIPPETDSN